MAVTMEDPRVRAGDQDPRIAVATPGCAARFQPSRAGRAIQPGSTATAVTTALVNSSVSGNQYLQRIPPVWIEGTADAFLNFVSTGDTGNTWFTLGTSPTDPNRGFTPGPDWTDDARDNWGLVVFNGRGQSRFVTFADMWTRRQPGAGTKDPLNTTQTFSTYTPSEWTHDQGWTFLIVDRTHPNVDWPRLEFLTVRAGAGFNAGNNRMLRALTLGATYLVLHSGSPVTAANRITGGGYTDISMTGPTDWELSSEEAIRVIQNVARQSYGTATNVWTRATHVALWTGPAATGDLRWSDPVQPGRFTARTGAEPHYEPRQFRIGLPNLV